MKLTIEELKALPEKEWVWIEDLEKQDYSNYGGKMYARVQPSYNEDKFVCGTLGYGFDYKHADYGKTWVAYKNKEAVDKCIDIDKKCCNNCQYKGFGNNKCEKLNKLFADNGVQYQEDTYFSSNDKWEKRYDIMHNNCCDDFKSHWLEYPIAVAEVECLQPKYNIGIMHEVGELVKIRPCAEEYGGKTYLGFYLGDLPTQISQSHHRKTHMLTISTHSNPAIFVPTLGKIIFGYESWWGEIENPEDLSDITDECINEQWYVKALKELIKKD